MRRSKEFFWNDTAAKQVDEMSRTSRVQGLRSCRSQAPSPGRERNVTLRYRTTVIAVENT